MLIEELVSYYQKTAGKAVSAVPKASILGGTADEILEMVTCYASDAAVFLKHGDLVNAFAASLFNVLKTQLPPPPANIHYGYATLVDKGYSPDYRCSSRSPTGYLDR